MIKLSPSALLLLLVFIISRGSVLAQDTNKVFNPVTIHYLDSTDHMVLSMPINPVYQLTSNHFEQLGALTAGDAVKFMPGVNLKDYGGIGGVQTVNFRSLAGNHTGVQFDGRMIQDFQIGSINLNQYQLFGIESIQFSVAEPYNVLSPASAFQSASNLQINSVLNTKPKKLELGFAAFSTSINAYNEALYANIPITNKWSFGLMANAKHGNGQYNFNSTQYGFPEGDYRRVHSALMQYTGTGNFHFEDKKTKLNLSFTGLKSDQELPGAVVFYNPLNDQSLSQEKWAVSGNLERTLNEKWSMLINASQTHHYTYYLDEHYLNSQGFYEANYNQDISYGGFTIKRLLKSNNEDVFFGTDMNFVNLTGSEIGGNPTRLTSTSVIGSHKNWRRFKFSGNLVFNYIQENQVVDFLPDTSKQFTRFNPYLGISYFLTKNADFKVRAFYKNTYRLPTFNELYYNQIGNNSLLPESADMINLGLVKQLQIKNWKFQLSSDIHFTQTENRIVAIPSKDLFSWSIQNIGKTQSIGLDLNGALTIPMKKGRMNLSTSHSLQQTKDVTNEDFSLEADQIVYTPYYTSNYTVNYKLKNWGFNSALHYMGGRSSLAQWSYASYIPAFIDWSVGVNYQFEKESHFCSIELKAMNILGKNYQIIQSFPMPGRYYQARLIYKLNR